jgi:hypothetical protein
MRYEEGSEERNLVSKTLVPLRGLKLYHHVPLVEMQPNMEAVTGGGGHMGVGAACQGRQES